MWTVGGTVMTKGSTGIGRLLAGVCAGAMLGGMAPAQAQGTVYRFDIPAESLGAALRAFGAAANTEVLYDGKLVQNLDSPALAGRYTPAEGLKRPSL